MPNPIGRKLNAPAAHLAPQGSPEALEPPGVLAAELTPNTKRRLGLASVRPRSRHTTKLEGSSLAGVLSGPLPFEKLAKLGAFSGHVETEAGPIWVDIQPGKDPKKRTPVVFLGGISYASERSAAFAQAVKKLGGPTLIRVALPGQGRTLLAAAETLGTKAERKDRDPTSQAKAVVLALDALGVSAPVHIAGLSYGGAIASEAKSAFPNRFENLLLLEPYAPEEMRAISPEWRTTKLMLDNPFNPFGRTAYRALVEHQMTQGLGKNCPEFLTPHKDAYLRALSALANGADEFSLEEAWKSLSAKDRSKVHLLVQKDSGTEQFTKLALEGLGQPIGSVSAIETPAHDIVGADPKTAAAFVVTHS